VYIAKHSFRLV